MNGRVSEPPDDGAPVAAQIAGLYLLKGLVLYGATLTFAGFYAYFMVRIVGAPDLQKPPLNPAMVGAAAALAGILGSAFALVVGTPPRTTNDGLAANRQKHAEMQSKPRLRSTLRLRVCTALSLEPGGRTTASWPLTVGIWMYALVAAAVAVTYFLNQSETPEEIRTIAIAFAGYVTALMTAAFGLATKS
jgi:hypothetical protein